MSVILFFIFASCEPLSMQLPCVIAEFMKFLVDMLYHAHWLRVFIIFAIYHVSKDEKLLNQDKNKMYIFANTIFWQEENR